MQYIRAYKKRNSHRNLTLKDRDSYGIFSRNYISSETVLSLIHQHFSIFLLN